MKKEIYNKATSLLEDIEKCDSLKRWIAKHYRNEQLDNDLKNCLIRCNEAVDALQTNYQNKFEQL